MIKQEKTGLLDALKEYMGQKNIDEQTLKNVLEESLKSAIAKMFGTDTSFDVRVYPDRGEVEIWRNRIIVPDGEVQNEMTQVSLSEARKEGGDDLEVDEEFADQVEFESFGRRAIQNLRQSLVSKVLELEKDNLYHEYSAKVGEIVLAEVYQVWKREVLLMDSEGNELILPRANVIPRDRFKKGDQVNAIIDHVDYNNNNPKIILSRTSDEFLRQLFFREVPEIQDGLVNIKAVARIPGERAKVAVETYDDRVDPVGAVVGVRGSRIQGVVNELRNESIDILQWTNNTALLIQRALSPAKNVVVKISEENKRADVYLPSDEIKKAIGKSGYNIKLAMLLTGYQIDVYREEAQDSEEEDLFLTEFDDEIENWVIDMLLGIGCDTAKSVLRRSKKDLMRATDLEENTIDHVIQVLMAEFTDEELPADKYPDLPPRDPRYYDEPEEEEAVEDEEGQDRDEHPDETPDETPDDSADESGKETPAEE